ncbi:MAG: hydrogenase expression/formation protein HypE [Planctomycetes bacterium]|nr:hydrogenase expression/formation protein HypE [Planctomycetota bacterium]
MREDRILLSHGGGGVMMKKLIEDLIVAKLGNPILDRLGDSAVVEVGERIAFTTDSFIVKPIFFRGGDIGALAVFGTVNDLAVQGATPQHISLSLIIEEGFAVSDLERILDSIRSASGRAGVSVVTGDTKVVERGAADGIFINTSGIGTIPPGVSLSPKNIRTGDKVIVSGFIGDHGIAVLSEREGLEFETPVESDAAPVAEITSAALAASTAVRCMRDPTRGGVAATVNEMAQAANLGIRLFERGIPVHESVRAACDMLGFDPLSVANEGKVVIVCASSDAAPVLEAIRGTGLGRNASAIGEVIAEHPGKVSMQTAAGGIRMVDIPYGEQLPRIC